jgi:hypothetical protein
VLRAVKPVLAANGLALVQQIGAISHEPLTTTPEKASYDKEGKMVAAPPIQAIHVPKLEVQNKVIDLDSGECVVSISEFPLPMPMTPQAMGSAITYARRYSLVAFLGLVADEDDDGNAGSAPPPVSVADIKPQAKPQPKTPAAVAEAKTGSLSTGDFNALVQSCVQKGYTGEEVKGKLKSMGYNSSAELTYEQLPSITAAFAEKQ